MISIRVAPSPNFWGDIKKIGSENNEINSVIKVLDTRTIPIVYYRFSGFCWGFFLVKICPPPHENDMPDLVL